MVDLTNQGTALGVDEPPADDGAIATAVQASRGVNSRSIRNVALGAAIAVGLGTAGWAIWSGDSVPLTAMLLYCMAASTLALYAATATPAAPTRFVPTVPEPTAAGTSAAWKLVETLTVSDASRLWCGIEPGAAATQETIAWGRALLDAVARGELPIVFKPGAPKDAIDWERKNPHYQSQVTRASLKSWANEHGHFPAFLQD
jgi:hypothetical protein